MKAPLDKLFVGGSSASSKLATVMQDFLNKISKTRNRLEHFETGYVQETGAINGQNSHYRSSSCETVMCNLLSFRKQKIIFATANAFAMIHFHP